MICLDYWHIFANDLYSSETAFNASGGAGGPLNLLLDSTASSSSAMASGKPGSTVFRDDANGARSIWP